MKTFLNIAIFVPFIGLILGTYLLYVKKYDELNTDCIGFASLLQGLLLGNLIYDLFIKKLFFIV